MIVRDAANDNGAMRSMVENSVREALNPVDQWRGIERLVALGWTEEAIALALALPRSRRRRAGSLWRSRNRAQACGLK
jgi:ParB family chromosome partitioning protein